MSLDLSLAPNVGLSALLLVGNKKVIRSGIIQPLVAERTPSM